MKVLFELEEENHCKPVRITGVEIRENNRISSFSQREYVYQK